MLLNIDIETNTSLNDFIKEVLINRFPGDLIKQKIDDTNPQKLNFSCPICGDSEKKKSKRRGNIYLKTNTMYCHMYNLMPPDVFLKGNVNSKVITKKGTSILTFLMNESLKEKLIDLEYFTDRFSLTKMDDFKLNAMTTDYIKSRFLNESINFSECCYHDANMEKIFIFNKDDISNKILGYSVRSADDNYYGPKYKMMNYSEIDREICNLNMTDSELNEINSLNNIFNILNINYKKDITICEGQFDSMFIYNCLASTGVGKVKDTISMITSNSKKRILLDNDNAGKKESIKLIQEGHYVFLWSKLINDLKKEFSNNVPKVKQITDINKLYEFYKLVNNKIKIRDFNNIIDKYFSNSMFDVLYI